MHLFAKSVSAIASGDYYQVIFDSKARDEEEGDPFDPPTPYLMVQSQFECFDGGECYVESDDEEYVGHFKLKLMEFSSTRFVFELARPDHNRVEVSFALSAAEFAEAQRIVEIIFEIRKPDDDGDDFGRAPNTAG